MRAWYRLIRVAFRLIGLLAALVLLAATIYEHVGAWRDSRVLKQIGRSVDIGGRTLNIHCTGAGSPTVVFVSGRTSPGYVWTPTQRGVSAFTRACWYDRADIGWSDVHSCSSVDSDVQTCTTHLPRASDSECSVDSAT